MRGEGSGSVAAVGDSNWSDGSLPSAGGKLVESTHNAKQKYFGGDVKIFGIHSQRYFKSHSKNQMMINL